jgi:hypothetical protein
MESSETTAPMQNLSPPARQMKRSSVAPRSSMQRVISSIALFIAGVVVGVIALAAFFLLGNPERSPVSVAPTSQGSSLVIQASTSYVNQIMQQKSGSFGVPGTLENLQVSFVHEGPVTVSGDDVLDLLGLTITKHFSMDLQLYASACKPMAHILRADFDGIPITGFVAVFEQMLNQQLQSNLTGLPAGFTYCITAIHTEPQGPTITISAQPAS